MRQFQKILKSYYDYLFLIFCFNTDMVNYITQRFNKKMCQICNNSIHEASLNDIIYLDCSNCQNIKTIPEDLPNLKFLSIYNTNILSIPSYPNLEALYCFKTPIQTLPSLPKLRKIFAQDSQLTIIPDDYYRLEVANLNNTSIVSIPDTMISLRWLSVDNTDIDSISEKLISLEWLSIQKTNVGSLPNEMPCLQYLNCSHTEISQVDVRGHPMLEKLVCKGCSVDPFQFANGLDVSM